MTRPPTLVLGLAACAVSFAAGWLVRESGAPAGDDGDSGESPAHAEGRGESSSSRTRPAPGDEGLATAGGAVPSSRRSDGGAARADRMTPASSASGTARSPRPTTVADFQKRLADAWETDHSGAQRPSDDEFEYAATRSRDRTTADLEYAARAADARVTEQLNVLASNAELQSQRGVAEDGAATIELRVRGRARLGGEERPGKLANGAFDPADPGTRETEGAGVVGSVPRLGHRFVVERVEVDARLGRGGADTGSVEVSWSVGRHRWAGRIDRVRAVFEGVGPPAALADLRLEVSDATARVRFTGRFVAPDAVVEERPFVWLADESAGFLRDGAPIRIQVAADHGGGNPRTVDLAGASNGRFDGPPAGPVWDETADLAKLRRSTYWTENTGLLPPGLAFRVTRIDWRARLLGGESHSRFDVQFPRGREKERAVIAAASSPNAAKGQAELLSGTWNGDRLIREAEFREFQVTCHYYGIADVTVYGRLEPEKR